MVTPLSLLWTTVAEGENEILAELGRAHGARVLHVRMDNLPPRLLPLLAEGAVVVVVADDREASTALSLGIDEVLRAGEVRAGALSAAIERARARAGARMARDSNRRALQAEDWGGFSLLAAALGNELGGPLMVAASSCEVVSSALGGLLSVTDELAGWAALSAPPEQLRRLVAMRSAAPSSPELREIVADARASLERAVALVRTLRELSFDGGESAVSVGAMLSELADLLRGYVSYWADLELDVSGPCIAHVTRSSFTCFMGALLASALDGVRAAQLRRGRIGIHASDHDGCVLVEVRHNGRPARSDLRADLLEDFLSASRRARFEADLVAVRERARQLGGDLLVDSDAEATSLRLILAAGRGDELGICLHDGWEYRKERAARYD